MFLISLGIGPMPRSYSLRGSKFKSLNASNPASMPSLNMNKKVRTSSNIVKIMKFVTPKSTSGLQKLKISKILKTMNLNRSNGIKLNKIASSP